MPGVLLFAEDAWGVSAAGRRMRDGKRRKSLLFGRLGGGGRYV